MANSYTLSKNTKNNYYHFNSSYLLGIALILFASLSCGRLKHESQTIVNITKRKIKDKAEQQVDKVLPTFDAYHPDTKFNKKRFKEFLGIAPTADVKNIYCFGDDIGIDADYKFAFTCDDSTISKIALILNLKQTTQYNNSGLSFGPNLPWWDTAEINTLIPYWKKGEHETYWYLWYEKSTKKAFFQTFDM